jgi:DNA polymerase-1
LGDYSAPHRALVEERGGWEHVTGEEQYTYAGGDGDACITVFKAQVQRISDLGLDQPRQVMKEYYEAFTWLEDAGACVDLEERDRLDERYTAECARLREEIVKQLGPINVNSPKQLADALAEHVPDIDLRKWFDMFKDQDQVKRSTAAEVLKREAAKHPVLATILQYRRRNTLHKFVTGIDRYITHHGGRDFIHSSLRGDVTATYRHSSSHPNLQNLPRTVEDEAAAALNVKRMYVSRFPGGKICEVDESQLELRQAGMVAQDEALMAAFLSGEDVHTQLAAQMRGIKPEQVTKKIRQNGKTTNFHVLYGGTAWGLSRRLDCEKEEAEQLIAEFYGTFTGFAKWERSQHRKAKNDLEVESMYGFKRRFIRPPSWRSPAGKRILRQAVNAPIQCDASMHTNLGIAKLVRTFREEGLKSVPFLSVHDSVLIDVHPDELDVAPALAKSCMEYPDTEKYGVELTLPLVADVKIGDNWGSIEEVAITV